MTVFNCQEVLDRVVFYVDGEIEQAERYQVDEHLKGCKACTQEYAVETHISTMIVSSDFNPISTQELVDRALTQYREQNRGI
ncbi:MAG: hypothetical protein EBR26_01530 [Microbacteriaceae bacterium]|nr:hypothetical protein [Microbacteriaceae bacterium]